MFGRQCMMLQEANFCPSSSSSSSLLPSPFKRGGDVTKLHRDTEVSIWEIEGSGNTTFCYSSSCDRTYVRTCATSVSSSYRNQISPWQLAEVFFLFFILPLLENCSIMSLLPTLPRTKKGTFFQTFFGKTKAGQKKGESEGGCAQ